MSNTNVLLGLSPPYWQEQKTICLSLHKVGLPLTTRLTLQIFNLIPNQITTAFS